MPRENQKTMFDHMEIVASEFAQSRQLESEIHLQRRIFDADVVTKQDLDVAFQKMFHLLQLAMAEAAYEFDSCADGELAAGWRISSGR